MTDFLVAAGTICYIGSLYVALAIRFIRMPNRSAVLRIIWENM